MKNTNLLSISYFTDGKNKDSLIDLSEDNTQNELSSKFSTMGKFPFK